MLTEDKRNFLDNIYFDPSGQSGSFGSVRPLYYAAKKRNSSVTFQDIKDYLKRIRSYNRHRRILRKFSRRSFLAVAPNDFWQCDVIYLNPMKVISKRYNKSKNYGVTVCDVFSKKGYVELTRKKNCSRCFSRV